MSQRMQPTDLELTHYWEFVPQKEEKKGKKFGEWYLAPWKNPPTAPNKTFVRITQPCLFAGALHPHWKMTFEMEFEGQKKPSTIHWE